MIPTVDGRWMVYRFMANETRDRRYYVFGRDGKTYCSHVDYDPRELCRIGFHHLFQIHI